MKDLGLAYAVHSINTHSIQSITTTPHDIVFGQRARRDVMDLSRRRPVVLSSEQQFAHDDENLLNVMSSVHLKNVDI